MKKIIFLISFLLIAFTVCNSQNNTDKNNAKENVQKIDIGGYSLFTRISGEGNPTVIFESGGGNTSDIWKFVQPETAKLTRTFSYDRAGLGKSDVSPNPRTALEQVKELKLLLEKADIKPPYIFVPNSYGAFVSTLFAYMYPNEVAGIVYVDGTSEKLAKYIEDYLSAVKFKLYKKSTKSSPDGNYDELCISAKEITDASKSDGLRNTPIVVLTSDIQIMAKQYAFLMTAEDSPWPEWQKEIAALSNKNKHYIIYGTGHMIHTDNPKVVINAIKKVLKDEYNWSGSNSESYQTITLSEEKMKRFVGRYLFSVDEIMTINEEEGKFYAKLPFFDKTEVLPISESKLLLKDKEIVLTLEKKKDADFLIISGKYMVDKISASRIDKNFQTPYELLNSGKIKEAVSTYKDVYEKDPLNTAITESRFNSMGYNFLNQNKLNEAIAVFKLNTEFYPESANVYDSYGEVLLKAGNKEAAVENYKKSVDLDPTNENGKKVLKKLGVDYK